MRHHSGNKHAATQKKSAEFRRRAPPLPHLMLEKRACKRTQVQQDAPPETAGQRKSHSFTPHSVPESESFSEKCQSECHWPENDKGGPVLELRATSGSWPFETAPLSGGLAGNQLQGTSALLAILG